MEEQAMRLLCVHAHFDDYEFVAAGTFDRFRERWGSSLEARLIVCTDGAAGHHQLGWSETRERRWQEQQASAALGGYQVERLVLPDGRLRPEANPIVDRPFLAALWSRIRAFEPDYLFCPPIPRDPLAGIHVDHVAVASAVRQVAYMINVPHAYSDLYPELGGEPRPCRVPVILNTYDGYMVGSNMLDFAVDIEGSFDLIARMTWCHQSQVCEWLPWVGRHRMPTPGSLDEWREVLRQRYRRQSRELGISESVAAEAFMVTSWGEVPSRAQLENDFPPLIPEISTFSNLERRLSLD